MCSFLDKAFFTRFWQIRVDPEVGKGNRNYVILRMAAERELLEVDDDNDDVY